MTATEILTQLQKIFCDVLDIADIVLEQTTTSADIEEWDSLSHIQLVVAIEKYFDIKFTSEEILEWQNIGDMIKSIEEKL
ncbi:MAG: acyl carrier protein [Fibromonadales bacterium]|nr:acyl carrier protein [Fibromonadales bacterium]